MGFFSDLKEDLSQAVNELVIQADAEETPNNGINLRTGEKMAKEEIVRGMQPQTGITESGGKDGFNADLSRMLDNMEEMEMPNAPDDPIFAASVPESPVLTPVPREKKPEPAARPLRKSVGNLSVIADSMVVNGNITAEGTLEIRGTVFGNVEVTGKLSVSGIVEGDIQASEIYTEGAQITGNLRSDGSIKAGQKTVILGNIIAENAVIDGAVKGGVDVRGTAALGSSAIIIGDIKSKYVQVSSGAVIDGKCSQCYADINPASLFDEIKNKN